MYIKTGDIWDKFVVWAREHGVDFSFQERYELLWKCYYDATVDAAGMKKEATEDHNG